MGEARELRANLERLQHLAKGLRDELAREHSPTFLEQRAALEREASESEALRTGAEASASAVEGELARTQRKVDEARAALSQAEQRRLEGRLLLLPFAVVVGVFPFWLRDASTTQALAASAVASLSFGLLLGRSVAGPIDAAAVPTLRPAQLRSPPAWALVVLAAAFVGYLQTEAPLTWEPGFGVLTSQLLRLSWAHLALAGVSVALALAVPRLKTLFGALGAVLAGALWLLVWSRSAYDNEQWLPTRGWLQLAAAAPVVVVVVARLRSLRSSRHVTRGVALAAGLAAVVLSGQLAVRHPSPTHAFKGPLGVVEADLRTVDAASEVEQDARESTGWPSEHAKWNNVRAAEATRKAADAHVRDSVMHLVFGWQLAVLALLAAWLGPDERRWVRALAAAPLALFGFALVWH